MMVGGNFSDPSLFFVGAFAFSQGHETSDTVESRYLISYGAMHEVAVFTGLSELCYHRGQDVVVATDRGIEAGKVLGKTGEDSLESSSNGDADTQPSEKWRLLRTLGPEDRRQLAANGARRGEEFGSWQQRVAKLPMGLDLVDIEYLLGDEGVILHVLADDVADLSAISATLSMIVGKRLVLQRFGDDPAARRKGGCSGNCTCGRQEADST